MSEFFRGVGVKDSVGVKNPNDSILKHNSLSEKCFQHISLSKVRIPAFKSWIYHRVSDILGSADEIVGGMIYGRLESGEIDAKGMLLDISGFMDIDKASLIINEIWDLLHEAQSRPEGIPQTLINEKKKELERQKQKEIELEKKLSTVHFNGPTRIRVIGEVSYINKYPLHDSSSSAMGEDEIEKVRANQLLKNFKLQKT